MEQRVAKAHSLQKVQKFNGNMFVLGCGSVAQCTLPILLQMVDIDPKRITVMDFVDKSHKIQECLAKGVKFVLGQLTLDNFRQIVTQYLKNEGDIFLDLAWNTETTRFLEFCHEHGFLFANTSVEEEDPYRPENFKDPRVLTLYSRQMNIQKCIDKWKNDDQQPSKKYPHTSACVDHGANPGLVSHFVRKGLVDIANHLVEKGELQGEKKDKVFQAIKEKKFNIVSQLLGLKTVHISERDSQITCKPKKMNEFVNTWSIPGLIEEGMAPAELGWGTHELTLPPGALVYEEGPKNQIALLSRGMNTYCRSWVPSGQIIGYVIRHGEAYGISDRFTVWDDNKNLVYRPTVHYVYCPCDNAVASMHELLMRNFEPQVEQRIMNDDITSGLDELGCLMLGDFGAWWIGSVLDIEESRKLIPGQSATTIQIGVSIVSCLIYLIRNPNLGVCLPDDLDHEEILQYCIPWLGSFVSTPSKWTPYGNWNPIYDKLGKETKVPFQGGDVFDPKSKFAWQFEDFLVNPIYLKQ